MKKNPSVIVIAAALAAFALTSCKPEVQESAGTAEKQAAVETPATTLPPKSGDNLKALAEEAPSDLPKAPDDVAAAPAGAAKTSSGLASVVLEKGTGTEHPKAEDVVKVNYTGWTTDGKAFDSSFKRGVPATFPLGKVIKGWTEGLQLMVTGEKRRLWIPSGLAYDGMPGRPQGMLVFDVELLEIIKLPGTPADVAKPPKKAKKTSSGLAYVVLKKGTETDHPAMTSLVTVNYAGWTTDGKMFDSSYKRGKPATFPLDKVIAGWTEGLQLMVKGETTRFWIPVELAYNNDPGKPAGMLVFDVELIDFK